MTKNKKEDAWENWYRGKTVFLTGATAGIGREMAKLLAGAGSRLILCGRDPQAMDALRQEVEGAGGSVLDCFLADLSVTGKIIEICRSVQARYSVDIVINNAAFGDINDFAAAPEERVLAMLKVNVEAVTVFSRVFLASMPGRPGTGILNVGSVVSFFSMPGSALYAATKHFVLGLTDALHQEMLGKGVHVTGLYPGRTQSRFLARASGGRLELWARGASDPADVAVAGLKGLAENKVRILVNWDSRIKVLIGRLLPVKLFLKHASRPLPRPKGD